MSFVMALSNIRPGFGIHIHTLLAHTFPIKILWSVLLTNLCLAKNLEIKTSPQILNGSNLPAIMRAMFLCFMLLSCKQFCPDISHVSQPISTTAGIISNKFHMFLPVKIIYAWTVNHLCFHGLYLFWTNCCFVSKVRQWRIPPNTQDTLNAFNC